MVLGLLHLCISLLSAIICVMSICSHTDNALISLMYEQAMMWCSGNVVSLSGDPSVLNTGPSRAFGWTIYCSFITPIIRTWLVVRLDRRLTHDKGERFACQSRATRNRCKVALNGLPFWAQCLWKIKLHTKSINIFSFVLSRKHVAQIPGLHAFF